MKVTKENINSIQYIPGCKTLNDLNEAKNLLESILIDVMELNQLLEDRDENYHKIYIDYIDTHTEYSVERTDPCPDYYGMFTLRFEYNNYETIGTEMTIDELNNALCILINFVEFALG